MVAYDCGEEGRKGGRKGGKEEGRGERNDGGKERFAHPSRNLSVIYDRFFVIEFSKD